MNKIMNKITNRIVNKIFLLMLSLILITSIVSADSLVTNVVTTQFTDGNDNINLRVSVTTNSAGQYVMYVNGHNQGWRTVNGAGTDIYPPFSLIVYFEGSNEIIERFNNNIGKTYEICALKRYGAYPSDCTYDFVKIEPKASPSFVIDNVDITKLETGYVQATVFYTGTGTIRMTIQGTSVDDKPVNSKIRTYTTITSTTPITSPGTYETCVYDSSKSKDQNFCKIIEIPNPYTINILSLYLNNIGNAGEGWISMDVATTGSGTLGFDIDNVLKETRVVTEADGGYGTQFQTTPGDHSFCVYDYIISYNPTNICRNINISSAPKSTPTPSPTPTPTITPTVTPTSTQPTQPPSDTEPPVIKSIDISTRKPYINSLIYVTVDATDNIAVSNVTADTTGLTLINGKWKGNVKAKNGTNSVNVIVKDAAENFASDYSLSYTTTDIRPTPTTTTTTPTTNSTNPTQAPTSTPSVNNNGSSSGSLIDNRDFSGIGSSRNGVHLYFNSTPSGASVYINRQYLNKTPTFRVLQAGRYQIDIRMPGYKNFTKQINYDDGIVDKIHAILEPINQTVSKTSQEDNTSKIINDEQKKDKQNDDEILGTFALIILVIALIGVFYYMYSTSLKEVDIQTQTSKKEVGLIEKIKKMFKK